MEKLCDILTVVHNTGFMCQGGDITKGDGTGGESIYGQNFKDESFTIKHDRAGLLSMANSGPDTNGSQFFVTLDECRHLDGKHVCFGRVTSGFHIFQNIAKVPTGLNDRPKKACTIVNCGQVMVMTEEELEQKRKEQAAAAAAAAAAAERAEAELRSSTLENLAKETERVGDSVAATVIAGGGAKNATTTTAAAAAAAKPAKKRSVFDDDEFGLGSDDDIDNDNEKDKETANKRSKQQ